MKKFILCLLSVICVLFSVAFTSACGNAATGGISVYVPDGAPALSIAQLMYGDTGFGKDVSYHVVDANEIASCVTYRDKDKNADICILPVNDASKLLGDGKEYKMLGTVTHGNLFIVSAKEGAELTPQNFADKISGKKVGVVQMPKFPGAVFKLILKDYGVTDVTMQGVTPAEVTGVNSDCDYFVIPEPAASTRVGNAALNLKFSGSLQELYSGGEGYPQAVMVAKTSLIESDPAFIEKFTSATAWGAEWLLSDTVSPEVILNSVKAHYADPEGTTPAFTAKNLGKTVIGNCAVRFTPSADSKEGVKEFLSKLRSVNPDFASEVNDEFFYINEV